MKVANILIAALIIVAYLVMIVICIIQGGKIEAIRKAYDELSVQYTEALKNAQEEDDWSWDELYTVANNDVEDVKSPVRQRVKSDIVAEVINDIKPDIIDKITDINTALCSLSSELSRYQSELSCNQGEVIELKKRVKTCEDDIEKINKVDYDWACEDAEENAIKEFSERLRLRAYMTPIVVDGVPIKHFYTISSEDIDKIIEDMGVRK